MRRVPLFVMLGAVGLALAYLLLAGAPGPWQRRAKPRLPVQVDGGAATATPSADGGALDAGTSPPPDAAPPPLLSARGKALCIMDGNVMRRWGLSLKGLDHEVTTFPERVARVACTSTHACVLTEGGDIYCVGWARFGDLGVITGEMCPGSPRASLCSSTPVKVPGLPKMVDVAVGDGTCGISEAGEVYCWGGVMSPPWVPKDRDARALPLETIFRLPVLEDIRRVGMGGDVLCALDAHGDVFCLGDNDQGQLGRGTFDRLLPLPGAPPDPSNRQPARVLSVHGASSMAVSTDHTCVLVEGEVYCWGFNGLYAIDDKVEPRCSERFSCAPRPRRVVVPSAAKIVAMPSGAGFSCVLDAEGAVYCWGSNVGQTLGPGGEPCKMERCFRSPHKLLGIPPLTQLLAGDEFMCGVTAGRELLCWGNLAQALHVSPTEPAQCKDCVGPLLRLEL